MVAHQTPLSMEFSRQEYWSELPFSSPGDLSDPGIKPRSPVLWADCLLSEPPGNPSPVELYDTRTYGGRGEGVNLRLSFAEVTLRRDVN